MSLQKGGGWAAPALSLPASAFARASLCFDRQEGRGPPRPGVPPAPGAFSFSELEPKVSCRPGVQAWVGPGLEVLGEGRCHLEPRVSGPWLGSIAGLS